MKIWIFRGILGLVVVVGLVLGGLLLIVDPNTFKPQIIAAVRENTGRELTIAGELELELYPYLALTTGSLELGNAPGFEGPFLILTNAHLKARLLPLFFSRLEVVAMDVEGLSLHLTRDEHGHNNWSDLGAAPEHHTGAGDRGDAGSVLSRDKRVPRLASLIVDGFRVSDARVVWRDRKKGQAVDVSGIQLNVSDFAFGEPFAVDSSALATVADVTANLNFATTATLTLDRLTLEGLDMKAGLQGAKLPHGPETVTITADLVSTDGRLDNARMQGLGLDVRARMQDAGNWTTAGSLDIAPFQPKNVLQRLGMGVPAPADPSALERMALSCAWTGSKDRVDISRLVLSVDNATVEGRLTAAGLRDPAFNFDLHADSMDLDRYRPRKGVDTKGSHGSKSGGKADPWSTMRELDVNGTLRVGVLTMAHCRVEDAQVTVRAKDGLMHLDRIDAKAYAGRLEAGAVLDVRSETPEWSWTHFVTGVQLGPFLRDLHGRDLVSGAVQTSATLRSRGVDAMALKRSLNGKLDFKVVNGAVHGVNMAELLRDAIRVVKKQQPGPDEPDLTRFSVASGSASIVNGVETTRDFLFLAERFRITASGQADLVSESLDYKGILTLEGSEGKFEEGLPGLNSLPVRVTGTIGQPSVNVDFGGLVRALKARGGQVVQDVLKGVGSGLDRGIEGLRRLFE